jgi:hypothetical protein
LDTLHERDSELDTLDIELLALLHREFMFTGEPGYETQLMNDAFSKRDARTLWEAAEAETVWFKRALLSYAELLGVDPAPIHRHPVLVVPDFRFGASCRAYKGRSYVLLNSGCMHLLSFIVELDVLGLALLHRAPRDTLTMQLFTWLMDSGSALAKCFLQKPFSLPLMRPYMDDEMNFLETVCLASSELFVFLHEVGHIELGHLGSGFGEVQVGAERPSGDEEFEADRFAVELLVQRDRKAAIGASHFLWWFSLLDNYRYQVDPQTVPMRDRLVALAQVLGDDLELPSLDHPQHEVSAGPPIGSADKLRRAFRWACEAVANELGITIPDEAVMRSMEQFETRNGMEIARAFFKSRSLDESTVNVIKGFLSITHPWEEKRAFIDEHPVLLSKPVEEWLVFHTNDTDQEKETLLLLKCDLALLRRCKEVGTENALPIKEVLFAMAQAESVDERIELLRAHPHVMSDLGRERAEAMYNYLLDNHIEAAGLLGGIAVLIDMSLELGPDGAAKRWKETPGHPEQVWLLTLQLDAAIKRGDLRKQVDVCEQAVALASKEQGVPLWSLRFREHLQSLPEF